MQSMHNLSEVVGTVHLIQATKLPARHRKMIRTQVAGASSEDYELILFEPNLSELEEKCLLAPEILTSITTDNNTVLVLENHGCEPIYLEAGQNVGLGM